MVNILPVHEDEHISLVLVCGDCLSWFVTVANLWNSIVADTLACMSCYHQTPPQMEQRC